MSETAQFYQLAQINISFFGAILIFTIWYNIQVRFKSKMLKISNDPRLDKGLAFISGAIFIWVISGVFQYVYGNSDWPEVHRVIRISSTVFSSVNSVLLLLGLYYFDDSPSFIYRNDNNQKWFLILVGAVTFSSIAVQLLFKADPTSYIQWVNLPDFLLSVFLTSILLLTLFRTFISHGLKLVAILSSIIVVLMLFSQVPDVFTQLSLPFNGDLIKLVSKSSLISIFLVIATTWVIQIANTPKSDEIALTFLDWSLIKITIPSKGIQETVDFGSKTTQFKNLLKFGIRRKFAKVEEQYIEVGHGQELDSQTYLTRIINNINSISDFDEEQKIFRKDIFTFVGNGKYRLRIIPNQINIEPSLLKEFVKHPDNKQYIQILNE